MREGKPRYLGHFTAVLPFMFLLLISSIVSVDFAFGQSQTPEGQFPQSIIASSNTDTTPHLLKLKATQQGGTGTQEVSGFNLDVTNTVSAQINSQLHLFVTDSSVRVIEAKVRTASDQFIDLAPSTSQQSTNAFSLANLPVGVYTLDVITQKGNTKAAYEGILEIGQQPATNAAASPLSSSLPPSPQPATSPVASPLPSTEQSDSVDNGDDGGGDEDNGDDGGGDEDNVTGGDEGDSGGGDEGDSGGGDEGDSGGGDEGDSED